MSLDPDQDTTLDIDLSSALLKALAGREPTLADLDNKRLGILLKPLLFAIDAHTRAHRLTHRWPPAVEAAREFKRSEVRLDVLLKELRRSPRHASFRTAYDDWISRHRELSEQYQDPNRITAEQMTTADERSRRRVPAEFYSTVWAIEFSNDEGSRTSHILGVLGHLDEILESGLLGSAFPHDPGVRGQVKKAKQEGKRLGEHTAKERLAQVTEERNRISGELAKARTEHVRLERETHAALERNTRISSELQEARSKARQISDERDAGLARIQRIREVLKEERTASHALEARVASLSDELRVLRVEKDGLDRELEAAPSGPRGLFDLLNREIDNEELLRDTTTGHPQVSAGQRYSQLKKIRKELLVTYPEFAAPQRPTPVERKAGFRVTALGGGTDIGASCYLLEFGQVGVLVDCGIRPQESDISRLGPDMPDLDKVHAIVVTHAHIDHVGWLPTLIARDYGHDIYCTTETNDLLAIMLHDSHKQLERLMAIENVRARYTNQVLTPAPYSRDEVERVFLRLRPVAYDVPVPLSPELSFSFVPAGHILGAASVQFEGGGRRIFFTGDFSTFAQETVYAARWPVGGPAFDLVVTESTYGASDREPREDAIKALVAALQDTVERGGTAIIPSFALGRAQEILSILARAMKGGQLKDVPVWIDGMTESIDVVYQKHGRLELPGNFHHVRSEGFSREDVIDKARDSGNIIVSTSGMLSGGPVVLYASRLLKDARNRIFFCGYQDEEQPGYKLLRLSSASKADRRVKVQNENGDDVEIIAASPARMFRLSAHSDRSEMVTALAQLKPKHVMLVHGDAQARQGLFDRLRSAGIPASLDVQYESQPV